MKTLYLYVDENHTVTAFTEPNDAAQEFLEFGGGCRITITHDAEHIGLEDENGGINIDVEPDLEVEEEEEEDPAEIARAEEERLGLDEETLT